MGAEPPQKRARTIWMKDTEAEVDDLKRLIETKTKIEDYPFAERVEQNLLIYDRRALPLDDVEGQKAVTSEWSAALLEGPGVMIIKHGFTGPEELKRVDEVTDAFFSIIKKEAEAGGPKGDHFGKPGVNTKIWNAKVKIAAEVPESFVHYYTNPIIHLIASQWLGPGYQISSTVRVVHPGSEAQDPHRDYHLGHQSNEGAEKFPRHVHARLGPMMTLECAISHTDMPIECGPTMFLPHSQKYAYGYLCFRQPKFKEFFMKNFSQLPLAKGDCIIFNTALLHAAGANRSKNIHRLANLLQLNSGMGRCMDAFNTSKCVESVYPHLLKAIESPGWTPEKTARVIATASEGYAYPANLDRDQPRKPRSERGAPSTEAELLEEALSKKMPAEELRKELQRLKWSKQTH